MWFANLYRNVDCQPSNDNVRWFQSRSEQKSYFESRKISSAVVTPIKDMNVIALDVDINTMRDVPYLSFGEDGGKEIYAFVDDCQYTNERRTLVYYTIDEWQTYMFNIEWNPMMVERENVTDDGIGYHLEDENLSIKDMLTVSEVGSGFFNPAEYHIIIGYAEKPDGGNVYQRITCNIFNGVEYEDCGKGDAGAQRAREILEQMHGKEDAIVGLYMCPEKLFNDSAIPKQLKFNLPSRPTSLGGYIPKNNKLFTYPYVDCLVSNGNGQTLELKYEYLGNLEMVVEFSFGINMEVEAFPNNYLGETNNDLYKISINNFPQCAFIVDSYKAWLAQNQGRFMYQIGESFVKGASTAVMASPLSGVSMGSIMATGLAGGLASGASTASSILSQNISAQRMPDSARGNTSGDAGFANGRADFRARSRTITKQEALIIDDYFTRYGYRVMRYKVPNLTTHSLFNYVKAIDPNITGNIPSTYLNKIIARVSAGVTLMHTDLQKVKTNYMENEVIGNENT